MGKVLSNDKGPKVELPEELASELEDVDATPQPSGEAEATSGDGENEGLAALELEELRDRYLRLAAEFENHKRRALKERQNLLNFANENLIKELLGTVDNLERALGHARQGEEAVDPQSLLEGVELTHRSLLQAMERAGVTVVEAQDAEFDPKVHEAIRKIPTDEHPPGTIIEVFQTGYVLRDRLLRPALVAVAGQKEDA